MAAERDCTKIIILFADQFHTALRQPLLWARHCVAAILGRKPCLDYQFSRQNMSAPRKRGYPSDPKWTA
jgi:hypothetical protein